MVCCRDLHKEVVAGIDEAMARHAQETDKVDLLSLKKLKGRVNVLEQQIVTDKARQLTVSSSLGNCRQALAVLTAWQASLTEWVHQSQSPCQDQSRSLSPRLKGCTYMPAAFTRRMHMHRMMQRPVASDTCQQHTHTGNVEIF